MPKTIITHEVSNIDRWLEGKAERAAVVASVSGSNVTDYVTDYVTEDVTDYVAEDGSNKIAITADIGDVDAVKAFVASLPADDLAAMERHGVVPPLTIYIEA